jgi:AbrB family looped-hinge helix DNA binding protein
MGNRKISCMAEMDGRGRLVIPASLRKHLNLAEGDKLALTPQGDNAVLLSAVRSHISQFKGILKKARNNRSLVKELIDERRTEELNG